MPADLARLHALLRKVAKARLAAAEAALSVAEGRDHRIHAIAGQSAPAGTGLALALVMAGRERLTAAVSHVGRTRAAAAAEVARRRAELERVDATAARVQRGAKSVKSAGAGTGLAEPMASCPMPSLSLRPRLLRRP